MTEPQAILPPFVDSTMMSAFRSCPQKYYSEFVLGLRPVDVSVDLHAGACFSSALEAVYRGIYEQGLDLSTSLLHGYSFFSSQWGDFSTSKKTPKTFDNVWGGVEKYFQQFDPKSDHVQPYSVLGKPSVEFSFAIPLEPAISATGGGHTSRLSGDGMPEPFPLHPVTGEPWLYTGRFDMLGQHENTVCVRDEKTASRLESNWSEKWDLRSQFLGYCWALQKSGIKCNKTIVRGIIFTTSDIRIVEAIKIYPQFLLDRWHEQLRRDLWRLTRAWNESYFDFNLGEACTMYSGCSFKDRCTSKTPDVWNSNYKVSRWNPLAKDPTAIPPPPLSGGSARIALLGSAVSPETIATSVGA